MGNNYVDGILMDFNLILQTVPIMTYKIVCSREIEI